ncbi:hypothetical protein GCM10011374_36900 [Kocuria dechangensis]|uniref:Uncharacterized protein n=1 Tax=Kocuria dechangensis TaxID=1176249 RepID=A0A917M1E5_9MICC|nr:hypothetical protein GCM10011374_36900 [Kocuria dechangensis]
MHQLPGVLAFIAHRGGLGEPDHRTGERVQLPQMRNVVTGQDPAYRARRDAQLGPGPVLPPALGSAQGQDLLLVLGAGAGRGGARARGAVVQTGLALGLVAGDPVGHALA